MQLQEGIVITERINQIMPEFNDGEDHVQRVQNPVVSQLDIQKKGRVWQAHTRGKRP